MLTDTSPNDSRLMGNRHGLPWICPQLRRLVSLSTHPWHPRSRNLPRLLVLRDDVVPPSRSTVPDSTILRGSLTRVCPMRSEPSPRNIADNSQVALFLAYLLTASH